MKLKALHEAKYAGGNILQRYEDAYPSIEAEPTQIAPDVVFRFYDLEHMYNQEEALAANFDFQLSAKTARELCRQVKCPSCASQVGQPCHRMRGQIHKARYKEVNTLLNNEDFLQNQDVQYAYGFVKHLLRKYNLPYTEIRISSSFAKLLKIAVLHPELKEKVEDWDKMS